MCTQDTTDNERELLGRARAGDQLAFVELVRAYEPELRALAYRYLLSPDRIDDALQEALFRAFRALPGFRGEASVKTWLYRITTNVCVDELRRRRPVEHLDGEACAQLPGPEPDPGELVATRRDLHAALSSLPADQRTVVLLVCREGLDYDAVSRLLGVAVGTVASRLNRARSNLRRVLAHPRPGAAFAA